MWRIMCLHNYAAFIKNDLGTIGIESIWTEHFIGSIYRPPSDKCEYIPLLKSHLSNFVESASDGDMTITGDLNKDLFVRKWQKKSLKYANSFNCII